MRLWRAHADPRGSNRRRWKGSLYFLLQFCRQTECLHFLKLSSPVPSLQDWGVRVPFTNRAKAAFDNLEEHKPHAYHRVWSPTSRIARFIPDDGSFSLTRFNLALTLRVLYPQSRGKLSLHQAPSCVLVRPLSLVLGTCPRFCWSPTGFSGPGPCSIFSRGPALSSCQFLSCSLVVFFLLPPFSVCLLIIVCLFSVWPSPCNFSHKIECVVEAPQGCPLRMHHPRERESLGLLTVVFTYCKC